jgi:DNA-binding MurR/RpiR family transcriptional regulator
MSQLLEYAMRGHTNRCAEALFVGEHLMILDTIRRLYPELTPSQRQLSDYIAHSYRDAAFLTASELAERLGLNEATVIRFAQRLGYDGYPDLVSSIRELVQRELLVTPDPGEGGSGDALALLAAELDNARRLVQSLSPTLVREIAGVLARASDIYVLGEGLGDQFSALMCGALQAAGYRACHVAPDPEALSAVLCEVSPDAVLVGISTDGEHTSLVASALRLARLKPCGTVAIACDALSPCAQAAEVAMICPQSGQLLLPPITAMAALVDVLAQALVALNPERVRERRNVLGKTRALIMSFVVDR